MNNKITIKNKYYDLWINVIAKNNCNNYDIEYDIVLNTIIINR